MTDNSKVEVQVRYNGLEKKIIAKPEEAWLVINQFFKESIPSFELAKNLWLSVDLQKLTKDVEGIIAFSPEGANLIVPKGKLTDNEALIVWLLAYYLGSKLNFVKNDSLSKDELQVKLGKTSKITSTRLGELVKNCVISKTVDEKFTLTTFGVAYAQKDVLPKVKAKLTLNRF